MPFNGWRIPEDAKPANVDTHEAGAERIALEDAYNLGVLYWHFELGPDGKTLMSDYTSASNTSLDKLAESRGYTKRDEVVCSVEALGQERIDNFFAEHLHEDEEIRFIADGTGYFDIRDATDQWVRVEATTGDLLIIPAGIYHRFSIGAAGALKAVRMFTDAPQWTPVYRADADKNEGKRLAEDTDARKSYVADRQAVYESVCGPCDNNNVFAFFRPDDFTFNINGLFARLDEAAALAGNKPEKTLLVFFITGLRHGVTENLSWCPDCNGAVKEDLKSGVASLVEKTAKDANVIFVELPVQRGRFLNNPEYPYRVNSFVKLPSVPTVIVAERDDKCSSVAGVPLRECARFEGSLPKDWLSSVVAA